MTRGRGGKKMSGGRTSSVHRLHRCHDLALEQRQDVGVVGNLFLDDWIVVVVAAGLEEESGREEGVEFMRNFVGIFSNSPIVSL
jgi:hypothetical protein